MDHVFEKLAYDKEGKNLCDPIDRKPKYFINLSAGLLQDKYSGEIIRIQSSHIESKVWDRLFYLFPDNLLYAWANGEECIIVDCSSNNKGKINKSVPIYNHIVKRLWVGIVDYKGLDRDYMDRIYRMLSHKTKDKIRYYRKFLRGGIYKLDGISVHVEKEVDCGSKKGN